jgi:acetyl esterase/lipase
MDFWSHWLSDLAINENAIIISPNYRLLPSVTSTQIYEDIEDFWTWVHSSALTDLLAAHSTPTEADLTRILSAGESAGGLLSIYLALAHEIRACTAAYPCVDPSSEAFTKPRTELPFGVHQTESLIQETIDSIPAGVHESSVETQARLGFMLALVEYGILGELYERGTGGLEREVRYPGVRLESAGVKAPVGGFAIIHGRQDSVVPVEESEVFVKRAREVFKGTPGGEKVVLTVRDGEHGFDADVRYEESWLRDTFEGAVRAWLE